MTVAKIIEDIWRSLFGSDTDTWADQDNCVGLASLIDNQYYFVRIGGLGGASAILMALYVNSQLQDVHDVRERLKAHIMASRIHFVHSFAMICMPLAHHPLVVSTKVDILICSGISSFIYEYKHELNNRI